MRNTSDLIEQLSLEPASRKKLSTPGYLSLQLLIVLFIYGVGAQLYLGVRPDLALQFTRPLFALEIVLLALLLISSAIACVLLMHPDAYQRPALVKSPYVFFVLLFLLLGAQILMPHDARMIVPPATFGMECTMCIACVAFVPSAILFGMLRRGASIRPLQAGTFAVLAASSVGCLTLRLAEANDSLAHLVPWHYLPTVLFAFVGALIGKWLLKW